MRSATTLSLIALSLLVPSAALAGNSNYGSLMFLGDSITVGADSVDPANGGPTYGGAGYRGFFIHDLNPVPTYRGNYVTPADGQSYFTTVGTLAQSSTYLASPSATNSSNSPSLGTPGFADPYVYDEGHGGAKITDLYNGSTGYAVTAFGTDAFRPNYVYLIIGSNDAMTTTSQQTTNVQNELALISYIKNTDSSLSRIYVEPPPSYPGLSNGNLPNGYDMYASLLGAALLTPPYNTYTTFVNSRPELTSADFSTDAQGTGLHPNDTGYQIIATDFYNATTGVVPEPSSLALISVLGCTLMRRARTRAV